MSIELKRAPTEGEVEQICAAAEEAAKKHLLSKVSIKQVSDLDVTVEAVGDKPLLLTIEISVALSGGASNVQDLVGEATNAAFLAAETKVKELDLCVVIET